MKPQDIQIPSELDELLQEWGRYFRDKRLYQRCMSIEGRYDRFAPGSWDSGWGDPGAPQAILPPVVVSRVLRTHECVQRLPKPSKWAITYGYCYPNMERYKVLKFLRKWTGRKLTWNEYLDTLDIGRMRIWAMLYG
jgi:hypothetical protein